MQQEQKDLRDERQRIGFSKIFLMSPLTIKWESVSHPMYPMGIVVVITAMHNVTFFFPLSLYPFSLFFFPSLFLFPHTNTYIHTHHFVPD